METTLATTLATTLKSVYTPQVKIIEIAKIKTAPWNPAQRVSEKKLKRLFESIEDMGLLYPLLINEENQLIDGHRRLAVLKKMGCLKAPVIQITSEFEFAYGQIQFTQEKLSGNDILGVYLNNPKALMGIHRRKGEKIQEITNRETIYRLYKAGLTYSTFDTALKVMRYIDGLIDVEIIVKWLIQYNMNSIVRKLMANGTSSIKIKNAINADKPLKVQLTTID